MFLSVVTTLFNSQNFIEEFTNRIEKEISKLEEVRDYELIFVNDGSPDGSLEKVISIFENNLHIKIVNLSRNFGHHKAIFAGLEQAKGDQIFLIDSDLEEKPENLTIFFSEMKRTDSDVVYGYQKHRNRDVLLGNLFYRLFRSFSGLDFKNNPVTSRLMTKRYLNNLLLYNETEVNILGLFHHTGHKQLPIAINKTKKHTTDYSIRDRSYLFINSILSFSSKPLVFIFALGLLITLLAVFLVLHFLLNYLMYSTVPSGYTSVVMLITFFSGLIIFSMGVIALYISKIFDEIKGRPRFMIEKIYEHRRKY